MDTKIEFCLNLYCQNIKIEYVTQYRISAHLQTQNKFEIMWTQKVQNLQQQKTEILTKSNIKKKKTSEVLFSALLILPKRIQGDIRFKKCISAELHSTFYNQNSALSQN